MANGLLLGIDPGKPEEKPATDDGAAVLETAAKDLIAAVHEKDVAGVKDALRAAFMCQEQYGE